MRDVNYTLDVNRSGINCQLFIPTKSKIDEHILTELIFVFIKTLEKTE